MESNDTKITRKEKIQIVFNILLAITIGALIFSTITIVKYAKEIKSDPIQYAIDNSNIESCFCINDVGLSKTYGKGSSGTSFIAGINFSGETGDQKLVKEK